MCMHARRHGIIYQRGHMLSWPYGRDTTHQISQSHFKGNDEYWPWNGKNIGVAIQTPEYIWQNESISLGIQLHMQTDLNLVAPNLLKNTRHVLNGNYFYWWGSVKGLVVHYNNMQASTNNEPGSSDLECLVYNYEQLFKVQSHVYFKL